MIAIATTSRATKLSLHPFRQKHALMSKASFWSRVKNFFSILNRKETPREMQERLELSMALLTQTHLSLRKAKPHEDLEKLIDEATGLLEKHDFDVKGIRAVRFELQTLLAPQVLEVLKNMERVDAHVGGFESIEQLTKNNAMMESVLYQDYADTLGQLTECDDYKRWFLERKSGALQTVLSFQGWLQQQDSQVESSRIQHPQSYVENDQLDDSLLDDFGFNESQASREMTNSIRRHQTYNLCRSALLKRDVGYSTVALKSCIPHAGRGIFVNGHAMAGSLVAFFPGDVWPKEHLMGPSALSMQRYFHEDPNYHLSLRNDDIVIDCRRSPYTNLKNPWALAHIANHGEPNCRTVMIDYYEEVPTEYIPNAYSKKPSLLGPKALDRKSVVMHGMALMALRDLEDEEVIYDYRLSSPGPDGNFPSWYQVINQEATHNRWSSDQ